MGQQTFEFTISGVCSPERRVAEFFLFTIRLVPAGGDMETY